MIHALIPRRRPPRVLQEILRGPGPVLARCVAPHCGALVALEVSAAIYGRLRTTALERLGEGLRCACGARQGVLEPWPENLARLPGGGRLYLFVA